MEAAPNLRWLMTSGAPGLSEAGELPDDITGQAELADGGMGMGQDWEEICGVPRGDWEAGQRLMIADRRLPIVGS